MDVAVLGIKGIPAAGGADRVVEKLLENSSPTHHYWVYIRRDTPDAATCHDNLHFIHVPAAKGKHLGSSTFFLLCCLHYLLRGGRYDLAHVHNSDFGLFVPLLRLRPRIPVLGTFHGDPWTRAKWGPLARLYLRLSERFFATFCHRLTSVSRFKERAKGLWGSRPVAYVPNGVDPYWEERHPEDFDPASLGLDDGGYVLFACGRLDPTKGLHHLLAAWRALRPARRLLVVGDFGHDAAYAARMRVEMDALDTVVAHPRLLSRPALLEALRRCRLFVFPSEYEAMSMMLLEAISCRAPVVCSDLPENRELLTEDYPWVHRSRDAEDLARVLAAALDDPDADRRTEELFARCMAAYRWDRIAQAYENLYTRMRPAHSAREGRLVSR